MEPRSTPSTLPASFNFGQALAPLPAAFFALARGPAASAWSNLIALAGIGILAGLGQRYSRRAATMHGMLSSTQVRRAIAVLLAQIFSKYF
jgi:MFS transporter, FSR family, fosmidomycin resistance protein